MGRFANISREDYYSNMYDIEGLTDLNFSASEVSSEASRIERLVRENRCDEVIKAIKEGDFGKDKHIAMIRAALLMKEVEFMGLFDNNDLSPKTSALKELSMYLGKSETEIETDMVVEKPVDRSWREINPDPTNSDEVDDFYRVTDSYIYELMAANNIVQTLYSFYVMAEKIKGLGIDRILDYGGGAGTLSIMLKRLGHQTTYADLESKTFDFAKWRFEQRGLNIPMINLDRESIEGQDYDCILCTEVFEHLVDPLKMLDEFDSIMRSGSYLVISESCEHVEDFSSHLESNRQYGGDNFIALMQSRGLEQVLTDPFIPQMIFRKN